MSPPLSPEAWFPFRRATTTPRLRLFAFPYAGGGASVYRTWPDGLPLDWELCAVQLPGRETRFRERAFTRMPDLIAALTQVALPLCLQPFALFGHSMGALVAFEFARELRRRGSRQPVAILASGHSAPQLPHRGPELHALADDDFRSELKRLNGTPPAVLENSELLQAFLPTLRADFQVCETYQCAEEAPLNVPIVACGGMLDARVPYRDLDAWREQTTAPFTLRVFPGDHFYLQAHRETLIAYTVQSLENCLRESKASPDAETVAANPDPETLTVWKIDLDANLGNISRLERLLSPDERRRADSFHFQSDRGRYIVGRAALRDILGRMLRRGPDTVRLWYNSRGKPELIRTNGDPDVRFNLAHSDGYAIAATTVGRTVGVDIECIRPGVECRQLAERFFAPREARLLGALPDAEQIPAFYRIWTRKEAYLKAQGFGLSLPLDQFQVSLDDPPRLVATDHDPKERDRWEMHSFAPFEGTIAAVSVESHGLRLTERIWTLDD